jgi:DNA adenine methylase
VATPAADRETILKAIESWPVEEQVSLQEIVANTLPIKPALKWAGGKRWLVPHLQPYWQAHRQRRLVEPFCGGLAVTLGLLPQTAVLNDINPHLISFYQWLKRGLRIDIQMENEEALYYRHRERFNELITSSQGESLEAAELFYYLNRTGYNGLCRFNQKKGTFNVPFGKYKTINYLRDFTPYREVLAAWSFTYRPFQDVELLPDDFVYADPPYDVPFTQYTREGFSWDDQVRLAEWLIQHTGPVVLSNQATTRIVELYRNLGYETRILQAPRMINSTGDRSPAAEVLATRGFNGGR